MGSVILVTDLETTGLDPQRHDIIDLWCVALDPRSLRVLWQTGSKVLPLQILSADPEALRVSRYDADEWAESAHSFSRAWGCVASKLKEPSIFCGHNACFDARFLGAHFAKWSAGWTWSRWFDYHLLDTASLAMPAKRAGHIPRRTLTALAAHYVPSHVVQAHFPTERRHTAQADARMTAAVLRGQLCPTWQWDRNWEQDLWPEDEPAQPAWPRSHFWGGGGTK